MTYIHLCHHHISLSMPYTLSLLNQTSAQYIIFFIIRINVCNGNIQHSCKISKDHPFSRRNVFPYPHWFRIRLQQGSELVSLVHHLNDDEHAIQLKGKRFYLVAFIQTWKDYWHGGSGLNFTDSFQMSSLIWSSVHVGWSKSKLNGLGQTGSLLMLWSDERYGWLSASSTANKWKYFINMKH